MKIEYRIKKDDIGKKLKDILKQKLYVSSILLKNLRENKCIYVNDKNEYTNYIVKEDDKICIDIQDFSKTRFKDKFNLVNTPLNVIYEDEYLLIINKPANMPVHPSSNNYENTLSNIVANYLEKENISNIHIVTRLDHNTTGICIFAKNAYIQELFVRKKDKIDLKKYYTAIVDGIVEKDHGVITKNIARKKDTIILREVNNSGDFAKTEYFVKKRYYDKNYTLVSILLHTGRTHQIRVHFSDMGHVLLGDELYGNEYGKKDILKYIKRQALHCEKITFNHPITNNKIELTCPIPGDMATLL